MRNDPRIPTEKRAEIQARDRPSVSVSVNLYRMPACLPGTFGHRVICGRLYEAQHTGNCAICAKDSSECNRAMLCLGGEREREFVCLFVGCLTSQQHASVSQGRIREDNFTCCHTEIEVADPTFHLTQSQYTNTGLTSPSADPITPGAWQGSHWSANV